MSTTLLLGALLGAAVMLVVVAVIALIGCSEFGWDE